MEVRDIVQETGSKTIPKKKKCKKVKWLSEEGLQIAEKRKVKSEGEKERYSHLTWLGNFTFSFTSFQITGREHSPTYQQKIVLKIYWTWSTWTRPSFPLGQSLPSGSFHKPLILLHQWANRLKTTVTGNSAIWSCGPQPCLAQWSYEPRHVGPPKTDGSWWRGLTTRGPLEKGMPNHFSVLALRTPWAVWKGKKIGHWKRNSPGQ